MAGLTNRDPVQDSWAGAPLTTTFSPFSWDCIPQLYHQGYWRSLTLRSAAEESHISDDTALQLLELTDEGVNLQILNKTTRMEGDFLENFRKRMGKEG